MKSKPQSSPGLTRRRLMTATSGLALSTAACSRAQKTELVSIVRASAYDQTVYEKIRRLVTELKIDARGKRVVLKPNLVEFDRTAVINTHPLVVHAALEAFRGLGAAEVRIAEGPGHRRVTLDLAEEAGYFQTIPRFDDLFTDLNLDDVSPVKLSGSFSGLSSLYLPHTVMRADLLVSLPKMKTHHWAGATLSMKNLFGVVPGGVYGWPKNILHWAGIHESIADLYRQFPRHACIVDGIEAMEGNGPIQGKQKHCGVLVGGTDMAAVDTTCCEIMQMDASQIPYLQLATRGRALHLRQIGEPVAAVSTRFELLPGFQFLRQPKS